MLIACTSISAVTWTKAGIQFFGRFGLLQCFLYTIPWETLLWLRFSCNFLKRQSLFFCPQVLWWGKGGAPLFNELLLLVLSRAHLLVHPAAALRHRQVGEGGGLRKGNTATTAQLSWRIFSSLAYKTFAQMWSMSAYAENEISFSHNVNYETKVFCWGCSTYFHQTTWEALETLQDIQTWGKSICFL